MIIKGTYKGLIGTVVGSTDTHVDVQIASLNGGRTVPIRLKDSHGRPQARLDPVHTLSPFSGAPLRKLPGTQPHVLLN